MRKILGLFLTIVMVNSVFAGTITRTSSTKSTGDLLTAAEYEGDISNLYNEFNGNIDAANLNDNAVTTAKIANDAVTPAKIDEDNASAFIMNLLQTTSTATLAVANITTIENSPTFTYGFSAATGTFTGNVSVSTLTASGNLVVEATDKIFFDGSGATGDTYIYEKSANTLQSVCAGSEIMQQSTSHVLFNVAIKPASDEGYDLGSNSLYWLGVYYGAGGLNQKPCFEDLKSNVNKKNITNKFDSLPAYGEYDRIETGKREKGFIIEDTQENSDLYEYITDQGTLRLDTLVAQQSQCIKDLNNRVTLLENQIIFLNTRITNLEKQLQ